MAIHKWQLKYLAIAPFMQSDMGAELYERLTARVLGTQIGMSRKWCYWFREHMVLCRRFGKADLSCAKIWLFQPGWSLSPAILSQVVTNRGSLITEAKPRLANRYLLPAVFEVQKSLHTLPKIPGFDGVWAQEFLNSISGLRTAEEVLQRCGAQYKTGPKVFEAIPEGSTDICLSMGRLEHFTEEELASILRQMRRILMPGGIGSHIVDHRDHFWHFDKSIHCFNHLTYSDERWNQIAKLKFYRNRMLEPDYIRLFQKEGFEVLASIHKLHRNDAQGMDADTLWGRYRSLPAEVFNAAVTHFILRRN